MSGLACVFSTYFTLTYILGTMADQTATVLVDKHASNFPCFTQIGILRKLGKFQIFCGTILSDGQLYLTEAQHSISAPLKRSLS
jgi:hypothetical protein